MFLTLDHINEDGHIHRKKFKGKGSASVIQIYHDVLHDPDAKIKYQVLCYNCNCAKSKYGVCPHQIKLSASAVTEKFVRYAIDRRRASASIS